MVIDEVDSPRVPIGHNVNCVEKLVILWQYASTNLMKISKAILHQHGAISPILLPL